MVLALNIETVAHSYGGDRLLAWLFARGGPVIAGAVSAVQSEAALYCALLLTGGGLFAWTEYLSKRLARRAFDRWKNLSDLAYHTARMIELSPGAKVVERGVDALSEDFAELGLEPVPPFDPANEAETRRVTAYLDSVSRLIRIREPRLAGDVGRLVLSRLEQPTEPQSPQGTV